MSGHGPTRERCSARRSYGSALLAVLLAVLFCPPLHARDQAVSPALKALDILGKHCAACHGDAANPRAGLSVYPREELVGKRKIVQPRFPDQSELMELVEAGNMPPGTHPKLSKEDLDVLREWISAGAPGVSASDYTLHHMLEDWKKLKSSGAGGLATVRYLSLSHLLDAGKYSGRLASAREDLPTMLASLQSANGKKATYLVVPVDPRQSVFRVNLADLGWERAPFRRMIRAEKKGVEYEVIGPSKVNLYDLALLEYPYAILPTGAEFPPELADYLLKARQVRPVPFVRADWLQSLLADPEPQAELGRMLRQPPPNKTPPAGPQGFRDDQIGPEDAAAELGHHAEMPALLRAATKAGLNELAEGKRVSRKDWEMRLARLVEHLNLGTAIVPLDGLTWPNYAPDRDPALSVQALDPKTGKASAKFRPGSYFAVGVDVKEPTRAELLFRRDYLQFSPGRVPFTKPTPEPFLPRWDTRDALKEGFQLPKPENPTAMQVTVIGFTQASLDAAKAPYPPSVRLNVQRPGVARDRILHDLYLLTEDGKGIKPTPSGMLKATITLTIE